jgi:hypothetical protein
MTKAKKAVPHTPPPAPTPTPSPTRRSRAIRSHRASVLRAACSPRRWPKRIESTFESLPRIVVRLAFAEDPWPERAGHTGLEEATALRLSAALKGPALGVE